jgi:hypothetical protein
VKDFEFPKLIPQSLEGTSRLWARSGGTAPTPAKIRAARTALEQIARRCVLVIVCSFVLK